MITAETATMNAVATDRQPPEYPQQPEHLQQLKHLQQRNYPRDRPQDRPQDLQQNLLQPAPDATLTELLSETKAD